jgi:hypothetical protein
VQKLKKIFALFSLAVFLFPFVEKEIHNYDHQNDFHCTTSESHLHNPEHHCSLCDYTNDYNGSPSFHQDDLILSALSVTYFSFSENNSSLHHGRFPSLRAPPVVA